MKESRITNYNRYNDDLLVPTEEKRLRRIEDGTINAYSKVKNIILKILGRSNDALCVEMLNLVNNHFSIQNQRLKYWAHRTNVHHKYVKQLLSEEVHGIVVELIAEADRVAIGAEIDSLRSMSLFTKQAQEKVLSETKRTHWGFWHKPANTSREIVVTYTKETLRDVAGVILFLFIVCTVIRLVPLLLDIYRLKSETRTKYRVGFELQKHVVG